jgi:hypothetical protein
MRHHRPVTVNAAPRRRSAERGQMIPILAIMSAVLFGMTALAADLSLQTGTRRTIQNATDAAALAAAVDLTTLPSTQQQRYNGAVDALALLHDQLKFGTNGSFGPDAHSWALAAISSQSSCAPTSGSSCDVDYVPAAPNNNFDIVMHSPPHDSAGGYNGKDLYYEIELRETNGTQFARVGAGVNQTVTGAHSIAYHTPAGTKFGYALWANSVVQSGNDGEIISGNVYAYRNVLPQSSGHAGICVDGALILGDPQAPNPVPSPDPAAGQNQQANITPTSGRVIQQVNGCINGGGNPTVAGGDVGQVDNPGSCVSFPGITLPANSYYDGPPINTNGTRTCVAKPDVQVPSMGSPTPPTTTNTGCFASPPNGQSQYQPGIYTGCTANNATQLSVTADLASGNYEIAHNPNCSYPSCYDLSFSGLSEPSTCATYDAAHGSNYAATYQTCLDGVTFMLLPGATVGFDHGATVMSWPPPTSFQQTTKNSYDSVYPLWFAPAAVPAYDQIVLRNGSLWNTAGTIYGPDSNANVDQNSRLTVDGQALVNSWEVQSGFHSNPDITYDAARLASQREVLRLVE